MTRPIHISPAYTQDFAMLLARECGQHHVQAFDAAGEDREDNEVRADAYAALLRALDRGGEELMVPGWMVPTLTGALLDRLQALVSSGRYRDAKQIVSVLAQLQPEPAGSRR